MTMRPVPASIDDAICIEGDMNTRCDLLAELASGCRAILVKFRNGLGSHWHPAPW
jgi:hypothetical protein